MSVSSAKSKWLICSPEPLPPWKLEPEIKPHSLALSRRRERASIRGQKGRRRGVPCLMPLELLKNPAGLPLIRMENRFKFDCQVHGVTILFWLWSRGCPNIAVSFSWNICTPHATLLRFLSRKLFAFMASLNPYLATGTLFSWVNSGKSHFT